jgi:DNA-binding PadR family transcriptional regulator
MPRQQSPLSIEYVLLGFIDQHPIHGYDLFKKISQFDAISLVWRIKQSQMYALLDRLEEEGLITSSMIQGESHPNRKEYSLTSVGAQTFYAWRSSPVEHGREIRLELLAKVFFALQASPDNVIDLFEAQKEKCFEWLQESQNSLLKLSEAQSYERIVFQYRIAQIEATIQWLEQARKQVNLPPNTRPASTNFATQLDSDWKVT